jgi:hypothetical protein
MLKIKFEVQNPTLSAIFLVLLTKKEDFLFVTAVSSFVQDPQPIYLAEYA